MPTTTEVLSKAATMNVAKLKTFTDHLAKFETESRLKPQRVVINGIPPFEEVATVYYQVPRDRLAASIEKLLASGSLRPGVLVNGIPSEAMLGLQVTFNGR